MSANQDDIVIRIAGDLADIQKSLRDLKKQTREAGEEARRSSRDWAGLGSGLDTLRRQVVGVVGAYLSLRTVGTIVRGVIAQTREQNDAVAQLEARLRSTENVIGLTSEQLQRMAAGFANVSTFTDQAIISAQSVLLTYTQIGQETFPRALQAALDFATAMRVDVARAAETVGRALGEPTRAANALREQGFTFTGEQLALIRSLEQTGRVAEAQAIILEELELAYGGAAEAARNTLGGALQSLRNAFGELLEGGGGDVSSVTDALNDLTELLRDPNTVAAFNTLTRAVLNLTEGLVRLGSVAINRVADVVGDIRTIFGGTDLERATKQIEDLTRQIDNLRPQAERFGPSSGAALLLAQLEAEREALREIVDGYEAVERVRDKSERKPRPAQPTAAVEVDARPALQRLEAQLKAAGILLTDELKRLRAQLDRDFEQNLVSFEAYYRRRIDLETQAINHEIAQRRNALQLLDEEIRIQRIKGDVTDQNEAKRAELVAQITVLERQRGDVALKAAQDQADAERALADQLQAVRERLMQIQGDTVGARSSALEREFRDLLRRLQAEGDREGEELVRRLINVEVARTELDALETEYQSTLDRLARAQRRIDIQVQTGVISEREGRRRIIELHRQTAAEIDALIPKMRELAEATGDPEALERLEDMKLEVEELASTVKTAAQEMAESLRDSGEDAFSSWLDGTRRAKDAWEDFVQSIRSRVADLVSERIFDRIFTGPGGQGGGLGQFFASIFHQGGIVGQGAPSRRVPAVALAEVPRFHNGGGFLAPDERLAILQTNEEVLSRRDPRNRLNGGAMPNVNVTIQTPDVQSFSRASRGQISAQIGAELLRARNRNG